MEKIKKFLNKSNHVYLSILSFSVINLININSAFAVGGTGGKFIKSFNDLSSFVKMLTNGMLAFSLLSGIAVLLYHVVQLALVGDNPKERGKVLKNLLTSVICIALLGSVGLVMTLVLMFTGIG